MTLKINRVLEHKPDYKKPEWKGTLHKAYADIVVDGAQFTGEVSTFDDNALKDGAEFTDVTVREYNGAKTYSVKGARTGGGQGSGGYRQREQPKTQWSDFYKRVQACWGMACGLQKEKAAEIFAVLLTNSWTVDPATVPGSLPAKANDKTPPDNGEIPF